MKHEHEPAAMSAPVHGEGEFPRRFARLVRRLRRRAVLDASATALPWLQLFWLAFFVGARLSGTDVTLWPVVAATLLVGAALVATLAALRAPRGTAAALYADRRLGTREVVTAAHEVDAGHPLTQRVRSRAAAVLAAPRLHTELPSTRLPAWRAAILGALAVILAFFVPQARKVTAAVAVDPEVAQTGEELVDELAELTERFELLERPESHDLLEDLEELAEAFESGEVPTVEEALAELSRVEDMVFEFQRQTADNGFSELVADLGAEPMGAELARAMSEGDLEALRETLSELAESLSAADYEALQSQRELERLAELLERMASSLDAFGRTEEAAVLRELAEALAEGELERDRELLDSDDVAAACQLAGSHGMPGRLADELLSLIRQARYQVTRRPSEGRRDGAGSGPGTRSTNLESRGYETGDAILRDRQSDRTAERDGRFEVLYEERLLEAGSTEDTRLTGQVGEGGEMFSKEGRGMGFERGSRLPAQPFAAATEGAPAPAVDLERVPLGYREMVREYFDRPATAGPREEGDRR